MTVRGTRGRKPTPWRIAMVKYMKDMEWHDIEDVLRIGMQEIPPEYAVRWRNKRNQLRANQTKASTGHETDLGKYSKETENIVYTGRRYMATQVLYNLRAQKKAEIQVKEGQRWVRLTIEPTPEGMIRD